MTTYSDRSGNNPFGVQLANTILNGTITTGGTAQVLSAGGGTRKGIRGQNISSGDIWINEGGTAVVGGTGSYKIASGQPFDTAYNGSLSIIGATTGQQFDATEY